MEDQQYAAVNSFAPVVNDDVRSTRDLLIRVLARVVIGAAILLAVIHAVGGQMRTMMHHSHAGMMGEHQTWFVLSWLVAGFYLLRLVLGKFVLPKYDPVNELVHGLMGVAMADMFIMRLAVASFTTWFYVFVVITAWYLCRSVIHQRLGDKRLKSHLVHAIMTGAMAYMLAPVWMTPSVTYAFEMFFAVFVADHAFEVLADWNSRPRNLWCVGGNAAHVIMGMGMIYMFVAM